MHWATSWRLAKHEARNAPIRGVISRQWSRQSARTRKSAVDRLLGFIGLLDEINQFLPFMILAEQSVKIISKDVGVGDGLFISKRQNRSSQ